MPSPPCRSHQGHRQAGKHENAQSTMKVTSGPQADSQAGRQAEDRDREEDRQPTGTQGVSQGGGDRSAPWTHNQT